MARKHVHTLVILPGPVPPELRSEWNVFSYLSSFLEGTILQPVWTFTDANDDQIKQVKLSRFNYRMTPSCWLPKPLKFVWDMFFYLSTGVRVHAKRRVELVITYGTTRTGLAGWLLSVVCGAKLIVEVPGVPKDAFVFDKHRDSLLGKLRNRVSSAWTSWLLQRADCCKLLYPQQLEGLEIRSLKRVRSFADLVPISQIQSKSSDEKYLLCIGVPWHLKGVDTLIEAFKRLRSKFPTWHLKLYGHCEDRGYFERLIGDTPQIEMGQGVSRAEAIELISGCSILVLPSRTEAMGRVLLEALAARKPIVASRVGGIPHIIEHEHNGLLFDAEDVDGLVEQLERLMSNSTYAMDIGERGFTDVHQRLNEERYVSNYMEMVDETLRG